MHLTADKMTSQPASAIHAGVNSQICTFTIASTASASTTAALTPLPAGAQVIGVRHVMSNNGYGTGGELVSIFANIGGITSAGSAQYQYINSATAITAANPVVRENVMRDLGKRITASANLFLSYTNRDVGESGTSSVTVTVIVDYLTNLRGD